MYNTCSILVMIDKKYVIQAFEMNLKGRFDVLVKYYGEHLFEIPAVIVVQQINDELGINIQEHAIYNLKRRAKKRKQEAIASDPVSGFSNTNLNHLAEVPAKQ